MALIDDLISRVNDPILRDTLDKKGAGVRQMSHGFVENVAYFRLGYTDPREVSKGAAFNAVRGIFWLLAGAHSSPVRKAVAPKTPWLIDEVARYAVLFEGIQARPFARALSDEIGTVFVVADSPPAFSRTVAAISDEGGGACSAATDVARLTVDRGEAVGPGSAGGRWCGQLEKMQVKAPML